MTVVPNSDPRTVLSSSYDGVIVKWIQGTGYSSRLDRKDTKVRCLAAVEGEIITSGFDNKFWRFKGDGYGEPEFVDIGIQPQDVHLALNSPGIALISTASGIVLLQGLKVVATVNLGFEVTASSIAPDGSEAIVGGKNGKLHIYSVSGETFTEKKVLEKHRGEITVIRYSPDMTMFASGDTNREAVVWDRATNEVKLNNMLFHTARINTLAWSPDSKFVATGSIDTCVIIYEIGKPASSRITIKGAHLGGVNGVTFADEHSVVSAGEDTCVRMWKLPSKQA